MRDVSKVATVKEALGVFVSLGLAAANRAERTREAYQQDINDLAEYLAGYGITQVGAIETADLLSYQAEMDRRAYRPTTRYRKTHALKSFFKFLHLQDIIKTNPAAQLIPPARPKREPRYLSEGEYHALLRAVSHNTRDAAMIEVLLQTGMRLSELAGLKLPDVVLPPRITPEAQATGVVRVIRKGGKEVTLPLNYKACQAVKAYLKVRSKVSRSAALFITKRLTSMSRRAIQTTVYKYLEEVGIREGYSIHKLRHTFAVWHTLKGTPLPVIKDMLGHQSLETTAIYLGVAQKEQRKFVQENAL